MKTTIALAAATVITIGIGKAYAAGGNLPAGDQSTQPPNVTGTAPLSTESASANNAGHAVSFMSMGGQVAFPPGYKPYYDRANHVVMLRYAGPITASNAPGGHAVSFMAMGGQVSFPPGYKPYYDRADHVVTLRYAGPSVTNSAAGGHAVSFMSMGGQVAFPPGYKAYYDHADHVVTLRYGQEVPANANHG